MAGDLILVIDNDLNLAHSIALLFQRVGYTVETAASVNDAKAQINTGQFRLVVMDSKMPGTNSILIPLILNTYPYLSLVVLADPASIVSDRENKPLGVHYLVKPVDPQVLVESINNILR